jgi:tetratricopeptide (TPR) repeat protein
MIPEEQTLLLGCFFFLQGGVPYFGLSPELDVERWTGVFQTLAEAQAPIVHAILGQRAIWDGETLGRWARYMSELWQEVKAVEASGADLQEATARLTASEGLVAILPEGTDAGAYQRRNITNFWRQLKTSAALKVQEALAEEGLEAALKMYADLRASDDPDIFFDEREFNMLGYRLLGRGQTRDAIAVFELNVEAFPQSWNVHDSLGEAYAAHGETALAIQSYRKSVELNPDNTNGIAALERLESAESEPQSE